MVSSILGDVDKIIRKISSASDLTEAEITERIKQKQEEYGGMLTESAAAFSVAHDFGISSDAKTKIADLREGANGINLTVLIERSFPKRFFERAGQRGFISSFLVSDDAGICRLVLWSKENADKLKAKDRVLIKNAHVRVWNGRAELNVGEGGDVEILESKPLQTAKLSELREGTEANVSGKILNISPARSFKKTDREGRVASLLVTDGTVTRRLVFWDSNADAVKDLRVGDNISVEGAFVKNNRGELELHNGRVIRT